MDLYTKTTSSEPFVQNGELIRRKKCDLASVSNFWYACSGIAAPGHNSPRFKSLIKSSLFILFVYSWPLADEVTWPCIWEGLQFKIQKKQLFEKARQIKSVINHGELHTYINYSVANHSNRQSYRCEIFISKTERSRTDNMGVKEAVD